MIMRCANLDMLSEEHQRRLWKYFSAGAGERASLWTMCLNRNNRAC